MPTPHLDDKHVVFGEVLSGKSIVRRLENLPTHAGDKPQSEAIIADCGELSPGDAVAAAEAKTADAYGDKYEDFPEDEATDGQPLSAQKVLAIATDCKDFGNKAFKAGDASAALDKYQKGIRYLDEDPDVENEPAEAVAAARALRATLNSNAALMAIKLGAWDDAVRAATAALAALDAADNSNNNGGKDRAKALYRRGLARVRLRDEESALADLEEAARLAPDDAAVRNELAAVKTATAARRAKEKAAYKKFFE